MEFEFVRSSSDFLHEVIYGRLKEYIAADPILVEHDMVDAVVDFFAGGRIADVYGGMVTALGLCNHQGEVEPVYTTRQHMLSALFNAEGAADDFREMIQSVIFG